MALRLASRLNRRAVIKGATAVGAGVVAAPYFLTASRAHADGPSEKPNIAAIGVGGRGTGIGRQAGRYGNMVACCDVHDRNAERFSKFFGGTLDTHRDYRKILDRDDVEAVTIGTPDHWHVKIAVEALQAGKDVYCEKPLTLTIEEGKIITQAVADTKRVFQVGTQQRSEYNRRFLEAVVLGRSGKLGKQLSAVSSIGGATSGGPWPAQEPPEYLDFDRWLGQAPKVPFCPNRIGWNFRWWFEYSGGQVTDWGVHHTDIALWALGGDQTGAKDAQGEGMFPLGREETKNAMMSPKTMAELPPSYNVARSFDCNIGLPNGNKIQLVSSRNDLTIRGELGEIKVNRGRIAGEIIDEINNNPELRDWLDAEVEKLYRGMPMQGHMANFFHCVKTREMPISDVWSHVHSVNCCHMANIAMLLDRKVTWDGEKEKFIDDDEANHLVGREQREPYGIDA